MAIRNREGSKVFGAVGVGIACVFAAMYLTIVFVDYSKRRPRESMLEVLKRPAPIAFLPLILLCTTMILAIMDSRLWDAAFWKGVAPGPFVAYFGFSLVVALFSIIRDIAVRDKGAVTAFGAFQNPSRLTNFLVLTGLASATILWAITH